MPPACATNGIVDRDLRPRLGLKVGAAGDASSRRVMAGATFGRLQDELREPPHTVRIAKTPLGSPGH